MCSKLPRHSADAHGGSRGATQRQPRQGPCPMDTTNWEERKQAAQQPRRAVQGTVQAPPSSWRGLPGQVFSSRACLLQKTNGSDVCDCDRKTFMRDSSAYSKLDLGRNLKNDAHTELHITPGRARTPEVLHQKPNFSTPSMSNPAASLTCLWSQM